MRLFSKVNDWSNFSSEHGKENAMSGQEEGSVQFSPEDFRTWNKEGFEEASAALVEARRRFAEADSLREKELAQLRLDSLEQLYRQLAKPSEG